MKNKLIYALFIFAVSLNLLFGFWYVKTNYLKSKSEAEASWPTSHSGDLVFHNGLNFAIWGKFHDERNFNRLPVQYQNIVRQDVWNLSKHSAGIQIRFQTNSPDVSAKWKVSNNSSSAHMTKIGNSGIDLYCFADGKWKYVSSGIPTGIENEAILISDMDSTDKQFLINLPLFDGIEKIEIGIQKGFSIRENEKTDKLPEKPIIFYGTSITQGGCVSRPGMAYPSIISRNLNIETINLGFSGNGKFEQSVGQAICEIEAKLIVIDCTINSDPDTIKNNAMKLIQQIRKCQPRTPVLLIESIMRKELYFKKPDSKAFGSKNLIEAQNKELKKTYARAMAAGITDLHYLDAGSLIGSDGEGTVDGAHLTDLGMMQLSKAIQNKIIEILKIQ